MTTMTAPVRDVLTRDEAAERASRVSNAAYRIALELTKGAPTYTGDVTLTFDATGAGDLFLDFKSGTISAFDVNGTEVSPSTNG
jgi:aminopeptidase N